MLKASKENPAQIKNSARIKFSLGCIKAAASSPEIHKLKSDTNLKLDEFRLYLSQQILKVQEIKYKISSKQLKKEIIHGSLNLLTS